MKFAQIDENLSRWPCDAAMRGPTLDLESGNPTPLWPCLSANQPSIPERHTEIATAHNVAAKFISHYNSEALVPPSDILFF
jgi:hypothetical protein